MGEWHPVIVHFPVALLMIVPVLDWLAWWSRRAAEWATPLALWLTALGGLGGIAATFAFHPLPPSAVLHAHHAGSAFEWHEWLAYAVCVGSAVMALMRWELWRSRGVANGSAGADGADGADGANGTGTRHPFTLWLASVALAGLVAAGAVLGHSLSDRLGPWPVRSSYERR